MAIFLGFERDWAVAATGGCLELVILEMACHLLSVLASVGQGEHFLLLNWFAVLGWQLQVTVECLVVAGGIPRWGWNRAIALSSGWPPVYASCL